MSQAQHLDASCPRCGATSAHMRRRGFVICAHCSAVVHDGEALAEGGARAIRRIARAMHAPEAVDADSQEAMAAMLEAEAEGDMPAWRAAMRRWLTLMPVTNPAYVPHWADEGEDAFAAWVEGSVDAAALARTDPRVAAAQATMTQRAALGGGDLIQAARDYYEACREFARAVVAATLRENPDARWLREQDEAQLAKTSFRMGLRAQVVALPAGSLPRLFAEVLGDRMVEGDEACTVCGGPRDVTEDSACPWCGAVRVQEVDAATEQLRAQVSALVDRGEDDLAVASLVLQLQTAPHWQGHALPSADVSLAAIRAAAPWLPSAPIEQVARSLMHMGDAKVTPWLQAIVRGLNDWAPTGARPPRARVATSKPMSPTDAHEDPWVRKSVAEFRMMGALPDPVGTAVGMTRMPKMMGGSIQPEQAAAYLTQVLSPDQLARVPDTYATYRLAFPDEVPFYDRVCELVLATPQG